MEFYSNTMNLNFAGDVGYLTFKEFEKYKFIKHAFSTKLGGVSKNEFSTMNLSFTRGDNEEDVVKNYEIFSSALNFDINKIFRTSQVHGTNIKMITENDISENSCLKTNVFEKTDGLITNLQGIVLQTFHADCPAIFMFDKVKKVVGVAHAGWRGTVAKVSENLLSAFLENYNSDKNDIICGLGPGIGKCCYEVSEDIFPYFENLNLENYFSYSKKNGEKAFVDLLEVNRQVLINAGLNKNNIFKSDVCTMCNKDLLFSHRATYGKRGNNSAFIKLL